MCLRQLMISMLFGAALTTFVYAQQTPVGQFEHHQDVGAVATPGSVVYDAGKQIYTIKASGTNMWATKDEFHYAWKRMKGNFILRARTEFIGKGVDPHRKIGWIIRPDLDTSGPHVNASLHGDGLTSLQFRRTKGAITEQLAFTEKNFDVVQLERAGNKYIMSVAKFGETFITKEVVDIPLGDDVYVGLYVCSHNNTVTETAVFRDVEIVIPARENFVPYREYIGSNLEVMDLATNTRRSFPKDIAPGDHPFYRRVYLRLMPIAVGTPKVVAYLYGGQGTINVPSWSPDSKKIAFVGNTDMK